MKSYLDIKQLDEHSWVISEGKGNGRTHCYLLEGDKLAVLVDTGLGLVNMKKITQSLTDKEVIVLNTHGHLDHISKNYQFKKAYLHSSDYELYEKHSNQKLRFEFHAARYIRKGLPKWFVYSPIFKRYIKPLWFMPKKDNLVKLDDLKEIELGNRKLVLYDIPGHTKGCIFIYDESRKWLLTGDSICEKGILLHFNESDSVQTYHKSLKRIKNLNLEIDYLYSGHQQIPLDPSYIEDYIECSEMILKKYSNNTVTGKVETSQYKHATITFSTQKIWEE